jgi:hypothetical protein
MENRIFLRAQLQRADINEIFATFTGDRLIKLDLRDLLAVLANFHLQLS